MWDAHTQGDAPLCPGLSACYPFQGAYLAGLTIGRVFILVYRLAMDARTLEGDGGAD